MKIKESGDSVDARKALLPGTILPFPGMHCTIVREVGRGSNAIVYEGYYLDQTSRQRHLVLVKELYPYLPQGGIERGDDLSLRLTEEAADGWDVHRLSFLKGNEAHLALLAKSPERIGANLNTFDLHGTLYTVLGFSGGRSLEALLQSSPSATLKEHTLHLLGVLDALHAFHGAGCVHLDVSPDNVLVIGEGEREQVMLIDFNSVHDIEALRQGEAVYYSAKEGYTPPEVRAARMQEVGMASDLFSVTAVFYRMIAGQPLTAMQLLRPAPPDVNAAPCMQDATAPVQDMVKRILRRGLAAVPRRRYQHIAEMRADLRELIDRIEGVGVTHWALWETGKRAVSQLIRQNASLAYLRNRETLYPLRCVTGIGSAPVQDALLHLMQGGPHALLTAPGGMGKTTALLTAVEAQQSAYSPAACAVCYVPLYGYRFVNGSHYILDSLLAGLHFRADTATYADARQALSRLLDKPLILRGEEKPAVLLLLDGLNEAEGDLTPLIHEILELSRKPGVRILVTGRTAAPELPFAPMSLSPLTDADVQTALSRHGLLMPESEEVRHLLQTPMMLSMFIQAALAEEKQLQPASAEELLTAYLTALMDKEQRPLDEQSPERWQIESAVRLVLPALSEALQKGGDEAALLASVETCWKLLPTRRLRKLFPAWTGHARDMRGNAATAEEWYGLMVHTLLWQRLGLLVRDEQKRYRVCHQILGDHLAALHRETIVRMEKRQRMQQIIAGVMLMVMLLGGWVIYEKYYRVKTYDPVQAETVFEHAVSRYVAAAKLNRSLAELAEGCYIEYEYPSYGTQLYTWDTTLLAADMSAANEAVLPVAEHLPSTGNVMPWSRKVFHEDLFALLINEVTARHETYDAYGGALAAAMDDELGEDYRGIYPQQLYELLAIDMDILNCLYRMVALPHMEAFRSWDKTTYDNMQKLLANYSGSIAYKTERTLGSRQALYEEYITYIGVKGAMRKIQDDAQRADQVRRGEITPEPTPFMDYPSTRTLQEEEALLYALMAERTALENEIAATGILELETAIKFKGL